MIRAVIYDMDGTLVDSERVSDGAWQKAGKRYGVELSLELIHSFIGVNTRVCLSILADHLDGDANLARRLFDAHVEEFNKICAVNLPVKPGARESIDAMRAEGLAVGLATSSRSDRARERLALVGLRDAFDSLTCGDELERSKPEPDIFLEAARRLGADPAECAVVEDSYNGVRAGYAAGMHVFMVPDLLPPTPEIEAMCDAVLDTLFDLHAAVCAVR